MATAGIDNPGFRQVWVSKSGSNSNNGLSEQTAKLTVQAGLDILQPGDVLIIDDGVYYETCIRSNLNGSASSPIWIVAKNRGAVSIVNWWEDAAEGTVSWASTTGGAFRASKSDRPYVGQHNGDFLFYHKTLADLTAATLSVGGDTITMPGYGIAFDGDEVFVKLKGSANPNGQAVFITDNFEDEILRFNGCSFVVVDGLILEGAGETAGISFNSSCSNCEVHNCIIDGSRFGVNTHDGILLTYCEFRMTGMYEWDEQLRADNGQGSDAGFQLVKNYFTGDIVGGSSSNALLEGGFEVVGGGAPNDSIIIDKCYMHSVFEGSRLGEHTNSTLKNSVMERVLDDGTQIEGQNAQQNASGNEVHDCLFVDCFVSTSHQESTLSGKVFVYRNVMVIEDPNARSAYFFKTILTATAAEVYIYHNTLINETSFSIESLGTNRWPWYGFSNSTAEEVERFDNNVYIAPGATQPNSGSLPQTRAGNAYASGITDSTTFPGGSGNVRSGSDRSSMGLNSDFSLTSGSAARGIGVTLGNDTSGNPLPDSRTGSAANDDAGAFPFGESPGASWPRPRTTTFFSTPSAVIQSVIAANQVVVAPVNPLNESFLLRQKPVILIDLFLDNGTISIWTLPFTGEFEGVEYQPLAGITGSLAIRQSLSRPSLDLAAQITGSADEIKSIGLTEEFQLRNARVRLGNLDEDQNVEVAETLLSGTMLDIPSVENGERSTVAVQIQSIFADIDRTRDLRLSAADQKRFNAQDSFFDFLETVTTGERFGA